ncbi:hypothetical protein Pryu01_01967 [Paraliobacillus ryukyuensis]|uniref:Uncharacterized protein YdaT n=1 Tax=Paraliobacillus ryukyuensis TaxID=200904 RepID=A0A366E160_9BACI|nr:DUF2188 domain-containing protein [Paraliobacillus ryukyuensis]RBO95234.1 uncharacterized protein YdaT [Paraliobacillus ryukyuensis]
MPWDTTDYPSSFKNLDTAVRKKAIDIANAMLDEGYSEGRAIPIATTQAKQWYRDASEKEINQVKEMSDKSLRHRDNNPEDGRPELMEKGEHVLPHEKGWSVQTQDAKQPAHVYRNKDDAIDRAKGIAKNKGTATIVHDQNGKILRRHQYSH